eukprot:maker-scaffold_7-snap-gene-2.19-mRNA-1 protein AED:0.00 eAED:0.00 QI:255/1/1/1/1/1/3/141/541
MSAPVSPTGNCTEEGIEEILIALQFLYEDGESLQFSIDSFWVLSTAIGVLSLQTGFSMLEAGTVQTKNVKSVLMKNASDLIFGSLIWFICGFAIFQGSTPAFGGDKTLFAPSIQSRTNVDLMPFFVQQFGFAVTSVTIVSGCILGRIRFELYVIFSIIFLGVVYPVAAHLGFNPNGFLATNGYKDFAGSGVVHMLGGFAGLVGAKFLGPRVDRFYPKKSEFKGAVRPIKPHNTILVMLGGFLLYIGWFSFNAGSSLGLGPGSVELASIAMLNTLLSAGSAITGVLIYSAKVYNQHDVSTIVNSMLTGLVAITGPSAFVDSYSAVIIGLLAGLFFLPVSYFVLHKLRIDDPLDAFTVHGMGGFLGVILQGVFDLDEGLVNGKYEHLIVQLWSAGILIGLSIFSSLFIFLLLKIMFNGIVVSSTDQLVGLDVKYHNGYAYPVLIEDEGLKIPNENTVHPGNQEAISSDSLRGESHYNAGEGQHKMSRLRSSFRAKNEISMDNMSAKTMTRDSRSEAGTRAEFLKGPKIFKHLSIGSVHREDTE